MCISFVAGGGIELPSHYPQWRVEHLKLDTPNVIQSSLNKLKEGKHDILQIRLSSSCVFLQLASV